MGAALVAGILYFVLVFGLGFILGAVRQVLVGLGLARDLLVLAEIPVMLAFAWWAAGWCVRRLSVPAALAARLVMGLTMFALLRLGEAAVGLFLLDLTLSQQAARLWTLRGGLEMVPQILTAFFPALRARFTA
jgi:hypothetical protein